MNEQPFPDPRTIRDHAALRRVLRPLLNGRLSDPNWRCEEDRLYHSESYFAAQFPTVESRQRLLADKRRQVDEETLESDHHKYREVVAPEMTRLLEDTGPTVAEAFKRWDDKFKMFDSREYFQQRFPTHQSRQQEITTELELIEKSRSDISQMASFVHRMLTRVAKNRSWSQRRESSDSKSAPNHSDISR